jgi:hypothetical protein
LQTLDLRNIPAEERSRDRLIERWLTVCTSHAVGRNRLDGDGATGGTMIRKLKSGKYRLYSRKRDPRTRRRRNLGTFSTRAAAEKHEHAVQFFKRQG